MARQDPTGAAMTAPEVLEGGEIGLLQDIERDGAITAMLFGDNRRFGGVIRTKGLIEGIGDATRITPAGREALRQAARQSRGGEG